MWIILAALLLSYMIGFLVFCTCRERCDEMTERQPVDTESGRELDNTWTNGLSTSFSCLYQELSGGGGGGGGGGRSHNPSNPNLPVVNALAAHREQQLRQIKLEINALSHRLGIGTLYHRDGQFVRVPLTRLTLIQPMSMSLTDDEDDGSPLCPLETTSLSSSTTGSYLLSSPHLIGPSSCPTSHSDTNSVTERTTMFIERQRRLQIIRMEIEDLTLQLSSFSQDLVSSPDSVTDELDYDDPSLTNSNTNNHLLGGGQGLLNPTFSMLFDQLPSYDESMMMRESPPPSYAQCTQPFSPSNS